MIKSTPFLNRWTLILSPSKAAASEHVEQTISYLFAHAFEAAAGWIDPFLATAKQDYDYCQQNTANNTSDYCLQRGSDWGSQVCLALMNRVGLIRIVFCRIAACRGAGWPVGAGVSLVRWAAGAVGWGVADAGNPRTLRKLEIGAWWVWEAVVELTGSCGEDVGARAEAFHSKLAHNYE